MLYRALATTAEWRDEIRPSDASRIETAVARAHQQVATGTTFEVVVFEYDPATMKRRRVMRVHSGRRIESLDEPWVHG
jgi:hypothetical protein